MRRIKSSQLVPNCDEGSSDIHAQLLSRFVEAMARRGVPELGARAVLRQIRKTAAQSRLGLLSDERAQARICLTLLRAEDKATELCRVEIKALAKAIQSGEVSMDLARARLRGEVA